MVNIFPSSRTLVLRKEDDKNHDKARGDDSKVARGALRADETRNFVIADLCETKIQSEDQDLTFRIFTSIAFKH